MLCGLSNCANGIISQNPSLLKGGSVGFVAGRKAQQAIDKLEEVREFVPELQVFAKEVCWVSVDKPDHLLCQINLCPEDEKCQRYIPIEAGYKALKQQKAVIINIKSLARVDTSISVYCKRQEIDCGLLAESYNDIEQIYLIEEE